PARRRIRDRHRGRGGADLVAISSQPGAHAAGRRRCAPLPPDGGTVNVDEQRRAAGEAAAALVRDGMTLGYGTGRGAAAALAALAFGWSSTLRRVARLLPGAARRDELNDDGNVVMDAPIPAGADLHDLAQALKGIAGVVDHGLFLDLSPEVLVGTPQGVRT